jgi:riboflavin biosynthesis pyrimidine reductase
VVSVGGAGLASTVIRLGVIDGIPALRQPGCAGLRYPVLPAPREDRINLELIETRTFGSRVVYVRYRRA